ncbi:MAG: ABC transporter permease subunit [Planctomycetales bacterium]|nr:ABC transporter permease subunit [Planctomycetales bacterium]
MFGAFFRFELNYWLRSMMVYVFLAIVAVFVCAAVASDNVQVGGSRDNSNRNSPFTIQMMYAAMSIISVVMTAAFANGAASRDFQYNTHQLLFTKPIRKSSFLMGRFWGAALIAMIPMLGVSLGVLIAPAFSSVEAKQWGPVYWSAHAWSFLITVVPNAIMTTALIFAVAIFTRSTIAAFISAILLIVGSSIASALVSNLDNQTLAALVDPFGTTALEDVVRYWTVDDRNTKVITLSGLVLANRALWLSLSLATLGVSCWRFSFALRRSRRQSKLVENSIASQARPIPSVEFNHGVMARLGQLLSQIKVDFFETIKSNVFIVLVFVTLLNVSVALIFSDEVGFGLNALPVTYNMVDLIRGSMYAFLLGIIAFYTGVLVWKERDAKLDEVYDALPQATWTIFVGKLVAMMLIVAIILSVGILVGIVVQASQGYTRFQLGLYVKAILGLDLISLFFLVLLSMASHIVSPNKYIGYFLFIALVVCNTFVWSLLEIATRLVRYGSLPDYTYSDMFGFAPYRSALIPFAAYWLLFATLLSIGCILLWQRGKERQLITRFRTAARRFKGPIAATTGFAFVLWLGMGGWIFYNTMIRNELLASSESERLQASYEKEFKKIHQSLPQPNVTSVKYNIDVYPEKRAIRFSGHQTIVNRSDRPIELLLLNFADGFETTVSVENASLKNSYEDREYYVYQFSPPMEPGQSLSMDYVVSYEPDGFENSVSKLSIVQNGSFFNNLIAPQIGYQPGNELTNRNDRAKNDLPENQDLMPVLDPEDFVNRKQTYIAGINEWVEVETTISTTNRYAVAPGSLVKSWEVDGRRYFKYKVDHPSLNFYSFISADFEVATNRWNGVDLEVYYHPDHVWNVENMLRSMRDSLEYYSANFGPYKHKQARIIEFPRTAVFAQAFPGTMPYSEGIGFIADIGEQDDIDMVYYVVAHEMAHQWWAHQVIGANMQGSTLLSETLAQYSALMVMEKQFGRDMMRKFLQYEMDGYLRSRGSERLKERPLLTVEASQGYIHYQKGSCVMYYLKEMIGEDKINSVLKGLVDRFGYQNPPFPTSLDLVNGLRQVTPEDLQYLLEDMFEEITLFANRTEVATYEKLGDGTYKIHLQLNCRKFRADDKGKETEIPLNDWIEIGAFAKPEPGRRYGKTLFRERKLITTNEPSFDFLVDELPSKVGVDPFALLIDRQPKDNLKSPSAL